MSDITAGWGCMFTILIGGSIVGGAAGFALFWFVIRPLIF